jgi:hypothetical protein
MRFSRKFWQAKMNYFSKSLPNKTKFSRCSCRFKGCGMSTKTIRKVISWLKRWARSKNEFKGWSRRKTFLRLSTRSLRTIWRRWICRVSRIQGSISSIRMSTIRWLCFLIGWMMFKIFVHSWGTISFKLSRSWIELGFKEIKWLRNRWSSI